MTENPKYLFLSPHFDDICFSLGGFLSKLGNDVEKTIINIFTRSSYIRRMAMDYGDLELRTELISKIRAAEDLAYCRMHNMQQVNLRFAETSGCEKEKEIYEEILNLLDALNTDKNSIIFFPMGVGEHPDHLTIFSMGQKLMETCGYNFAIYEDLPYAHVKRDRYGRIGEISNFLIESGFKNYRYKLSSAAIDEKKKGILCYESQHRYKNAHRIRILRYYVRRGIIPRAEECLWVSNVNGGMDHFLKNGLL